MSDDLLINARTTINEIDRELANLFVQRMNAVKDVARYKKEHGLPVFDEEREKVVIKKNMELVNDEEYKPYFETFIKDVMNVSKDYQRAYIDNNTN